MIRKNGGMYFWRLGRFGGSFYVKRQRPGLGEYIIVGAAAFGTGFFGMIFGLEYFL